MNKWTINPPSETRKRGTHDCADSQFYPLKKSPIHTREQNGLLYCVYSSMLLYVLAAVWLIGFCPPPTRLYVLAISFNVHRTFWILDYDSALAWMSFEIWNGHENHSLQIASKKRYLIPTASVDELKIEKLPSTQHALSLALSVTHTSSHMARQPSKLIVCW